MPTEFKTFAEDPQGFIVHVTVSDPDRDEAWRLFWGLMATLKEQQYKPNKGFENKVIRQGGGKPPPPKPTVAVDGKSVEVKCGQCGGPVWDNRAENDKREAAGQRRRPDFACKKKDDCGWIAWNAYDVERELTPVGDEQVDPNDLPFE